MNKLLSIIPVLFLLIGFHSCAPAVPDDSRVVTVSIEPLRYVVEHIAGKDVRVNVLTPAGASPETYQPTPRQLVDLDNSRAYIKVGTLGFEKTRLEQMMANTPHLLQVNASVGIDSLPDVCSDHDHGDGGADPHTWMSCVNMRKIAANVCEALCQEDTARVDDYTRNLAAFNNKIDSVDSVVKASLANVKSRTFLIYHPALGYFARDYGLHQLSVEQDGKEPSAARIAQLIDDCRRDSVHTIFIQKEHAGRAARRISEATGIPVVGINPLSYYWDVQMVNIAKALAK